MLLLTADVDHRRPDNRSLCKGIDVKACLAVAQADRERERLNRFEIDLSITRDLGIDRVGFLIVDQPPVDQRREKRNEERCVLIEEFILDLLDRELLGTAIKTPNDPGEAGI